MSDLERIAVCGLAVALTLLVGWWMVRARDDSRVLPAPAVPSDPDAYELAYLRGGARELARVLIVALVERRHLVLGGTVDEPLIGRSDGPALDDLSDIERAVVVWCATWRKPQEVFARLGLADQLESFCTRYRERLEAEQLINSSEVRDRALSVRVAGSTVLAVLGLIALAQVRPPPHFLAWVMCIGVPVAALCSVTRVPVASYRGRSLIQRLRQAHAQLKTEPPKWIGGPHASSAILIGLFGIGALATTGVTDYKQVFAKASASSGGGCGACGSCGGCGSCGSCGGGCGD